MTSDPLIFNYLHSSPKKNHNSSFQKPQTHFSHHKNYTRRPDDFRFLVSLFAMVAPPIDTWVRRSWNERGHQAINDATSGCFRLSVIPPIHLLEFGQSTADGESVGDRFKRLILIRGLIASGNCRLSTWWMFQCSNHLKWHGRIQERRYPNSILDSLCEFLGTLIFVWIDHTSLK